MALANTEYDAVMRYYDELRETHRHALEGRIAEVNQKVPEIAALNDRAADESLRAARIRIADPAAPIDGYRTRMRDISARRIRLLVQHGYPADYLEMRYTCPICHDTGLVDGKHCECFKKAAARLIYGSFSPEGILEIENFSRFSFDYYSDKIKDESTGRTARELADRAYRAALAFSRAAPASGGNLYVYGSAGTGKTFLTHCVAKEAIDRGRTVLYFSSGDFFDAMADAQFGRAPMDGARLITGCEMLIIDDLGTERNNEFVSSCLFRVVNERLTHRRPTMISTNLTLGDLRDKYSMRVSSRITSSYRILKLIGDDIRILKKIGTGEPGRVS